MWSHRYFRRYILIHSDHLFTVIEVAWNPFQNWPLYPVKIYCFPIAAFLAWSVNVDPSEKKKNLVIPTLAHKGILVPELELPYILPSFSIHAMEEWLILISNATCWGDSCAFSSKWRFTFVLSPKEAPWFFLCQTSSVNYKCMNFANSVLRYGWKFLQE